MGLTAGDTGWTGVTGCSRDAQHLRRLGHERLDRGRRRSRSVTYFTPRMQRCAARLHLQAGRYCRPRPSNTRLPGGNNDSDSWSVGGELPRARCRRLQRGLFGRTSTPLRTEIGRRQQTFSNFGLQGRHRARSASTSPIPRTMPATATRRTATITVTVERRHEVFDGWPDVGQRWLRTCWIDGDNGRKMTNPTMLSAWPTCWRRVFPGRVRCSQAEDGDDGRRRLRGPASRSASDRRGLPRNGGTKPNGLPG